MATKQEWIGAFALTLQEYANKTHTGSFASCAKCKLADIINDQYDNAVCRAVCRADCLEGKHGAGYPYCFPCTTRFAKADDSNMLSDASLQIEYHERALVMLDELPEDENWFTTAQQKLVEIDNDLKSEFNNETDIQI